MDNSHYARLLRETAQLLEIRGDNPFRVRAFENAARTVESLAEPLEEVMARGALTEVKGIGKGLAVDLEEIRRTGTSELHRALCGEMDAGLLELLQLGGLGPKRVKTLYQELGVANPAALRQALEEGRVQALSGFGARMAEKLVAELVRVEASGGRVPLTAARPVAEHIMARLGAVSGVEAIAIAGSLRRGRETIGDIDIVVGARGSAALFDCLVQMGEVSEVLARGETKTSVRLHEGLQVDVRVVDPGCFGAALHYFTGSKEHHVELRTLAKRQGLKISEYGVFRGEEPEPVAAATEEALYRALGLGYIAPELREGREEIARAQRGDLPRLLEAGDVRGDLHMHTTETDGLNSIEEMARGAMAQGLGYIVITDHSEAVRVANGMSAARFRQHMGRMREVDAKMRELHGFRVLAGIEVDILKGGELDMEAGLLAECDWVIGSVHSHFGLEPGAMTERLLRAMQTGLVSALGHPTGRILGGRDGYRYDMNAVLEGAVEFGVAVEINGSAGRLDFNAENAERARARGVMITLGSDAHSVRGLSDLGYAVQQARRAWLGPQDVLNCLAPEALVRAVRPGLWAGRMGPA